MVSINEEAERAFRRRILKKDPGLANDAEALDRKVVEQSTKLKQTCAFEQTSRSKILELFVKHLHWHPVTHLQALPYSARNYMDTVLRRQVSEMHELCKELGESWAWEYLWKNWYPPLRSLF